MRGEFIYLKSFDDNGKRIVSKIKYISDEQILRYMEEFLKENDQMPTVRNLSEKFDRSMNAIHQRLAKLERKGFLVRNSNGKLMRSREKCN